MQSTVAVRSALILGALTIVALCTSAPMAVAAAGGLPVDGTATTTTAALCEPGVIEKMPPHIRKVCMALDSAAQLSASLFAYLHNQRSGNLAGNCKKIKRFRNVHFFLLVRLSPPPLYAPALLYQSDELPLPGCKFDRSIRFARF